MARPSPSRRREKKSPKGPGPTSGGRRRVTLETGDSRREQFPPEGEDLSGRIAELEESLGRLASPSPVRKGASTVPKSLVKFIVGIFLLPPAWILTAAFVRSLSLKELNGPFGFLTCGMVLFAILFAVVPRNTLMLPYVFGHEVTHAIWAKLFGGKVEDRFHVSLEGGHVLTDRVNTWIALSPYFFPFYSVLTATLWGVLLLAAKTLDTPDLVHAMDALRWLFFLLIGLTLAFHLVFTAMLIARGQPDLHYGGSFFSIMLIYCINLGILTALLLATSRAVTLENYGSIAAECAGGMISTIRRGCGELLWLISLLRGSLGV